MNSIDSLLKSESVNNLNSTFSITHFASFNLMNYPPVKIWTFLVVKAPLISVQASGGASRRPPPPPQTAAIFWAPTQNISNFYDTYF